MHKASDVLSPEERPYHPTLQFRSLSSVERQKVGHRLERFAIASVQAFSLLHRICYVARPAGPETAGRGDVPSSDHEDGSDNMATSDSGDSKDKDVHDGALCFSNNKYAAALCSPVPPWI